MCLSGCRYDWWWVLLWSNTVKYLLPIKLPITLFIQGPSGMVLLANFWWSTHSWRILQLFVKQLLVRSRMILNLNSIIFQGFFYVVLQLFIQTLWYDIITGLDREISSFKLIFNWKSWTLSTLFSFVVKTSLNSANNCLDCSFSSVWRPDRLMLLMAFTWCSCKFLQLTFIDRSVFFNLCMGFCLFCWVLWWPDNWGSSVW